MKKISIIFLIIGFLLLANIAKAQIEVNNLGNSGFGKTDPIAKLEVQEEQYIMFNAHDENPAGLLFYETYDKTPTSVEIGAFIEYNPDVDSMQLGTYQFDKIIGMHFYRNTGHVGIGSINKNWTYELRVDDDVQILNRLLVGGDAWVHGNEVVTSDINVKSNIAALEGNEVLNKLIQLKGRSYQYKTKEELESYFQSTGQELVASRVAETDSSSNHSTIDLPNFPAGTQYGLIAQEVKDVFPAAVKYDEELQMYGIDYNSLIPLLIEATKEQQHLISQLSIQVELLQKELSINELKKSGALGIDAEALSDSPILYQNNPNPFSESTIIKYNLPEAIERGSIIIYDMNGKQIKSIALSTRGESQVSIAAGEFDAGMYLYSLIANGQLIDTRQMVITD